MNLIYTANVIFQVTFSVSRMILLPEAELASTILSYTVKLFTEILLELEDANSQNDLKKIIRIYNKYK